MKEMVPGWTGSLNVAETELMVETPVAAGSRSLSRHRGRREVHVARVEDDIDPVVGRVEGAGREAAAVE